MQRVSSGENLSLICIAGLKLIKIYLASLTVVIAQRGTTCNLGTKKNQVMEGSYYQATKQVEKAYPV